MEKLLMCKDIIGLTSNFVTILAFILAIFAFFHWKKEQKFAKQLDYLMGLEDSFEILMHDIKNQFKWFSDLDRSLIGIKDKDEAYKRELDVRIKDEWGKYKANMTIEHSFYQYSLSLIRVKRFFKDIDRECNDLSFEHLNKLSDEGIRLEPKWKDENSISKNSQEYLEKVTESHKKVRSFLRKKHT